MENGSEITYRGRGDRGCTHQSRIDAGAEAGGGRLRVMIEGGYCSDLEPEGDDRESTLAVGGELVHFGRKRIVMGGKIFILLKYINSSSA
jgi:hypothetical protein